MSFSRLWVNSATLLGFSCMETLRVNMSLSLVVIAKGAIQITSIGSGDLKTPSVP